MLRPGRNTHSAFHTAESAGTARPIGSRDWRTDIRHVFPLEGTLGKGDTLKPCVRFSGSVALARLRPSYVFSVPPVPRVPRVPCVPFDKGIDARAMPKDTGKV